MSIILTCNAGSDNTKLAAFNTKTFACEGHIQTHNEAETMEWLCSIGALGIVAAGHRVVHGGREFTKPTRITDDVVAKLKTYIPLAPLHQPAALRLIDEARRLYPNVPHIACFDTAFHSTLPDIERHLALPARITGKHIERYGFHGISYQYIASQLPKIAGKKAKGRVIVAHLGGGSSMCAMKNLQSVATTMGFSTLDGLMMGTRCGALDPGVILHLLKQEKMSLDEVEKLLYRESGLKGVSGFSADMEALTHSKDKKAQVAIELYCYLAAKQLGGLLMALGGLDAVVFTGGIGEHSRAVRAKVCDYLAWLGVKLSTKQTGACISTPASKVAVYVIATDEEKIIAHACRNLAK